MNVRWQFWPYGRYKSYYCKGFIHGKICFLLYITVSLSFSFIIRYSLPPKLAKSNVKIMQRSKLPNFLMQHKCNIREIVNFQRCISFTLNFGCLGNFALKFLEKLQYLKKKNRIFLSRIVYSITIEFYFYFNLKSFRDIWIRSY